MEACGRSGDNDQLILNLGAIWGWVVSFTLRPIFQRTHWIRGGLKVMKTETLVPAGYRSPVV